MSEAKRNTIYPKNYNQKAQKEFLVRSCHLQAIQDNGFLFIDEVETSLHPQLTQIYFAQLLKKRIVQITIINHNPL
jgi:AAA15 family ATPase/GTPase